MMRIALIAFFALIAALACGSESLPTDTPVPALERPDNLYTQNDGHTVWVEWRGPARADSYLVHYRKIGDQEWQVKQVEREITMFFELDPESEWEVKVAAQREGTPDSEFSPPFQFRPPAWK